MKFMAEYVDMIMCLWMKYCEMLEIVERMLGCSYSLIGILCLYDSSHVTHAG